MSAPRAAMLAIALAAAAALGGCKLVDRTTFGATPRPPAQSQLAQALAANGRIPLVTIRFNGNETAYENILNQAVADAQAHHPGVRYVVANTVPGTGSLQGQVALAEQSQQDAQNVADAIIAMGVSPSDVTLTMATDPTIREREVRVYVH